MKVDKSKISPGIAKLLHEFEDKYAEFHEMTINEKRKTLDTMYLKGSEKISVNSVDDSIVFWGGLNIPIRIYENYTKEKLPVLVYFHGGGWVLGGLDSQDRFCRLVAKTYECAVISVDYRLAPENKFPLALDDCVAVLDWLGSRAANKKWDFAQIVTAGDSAGGNLAAIAGKIFNSKHSEVKILHQVLIYPITDLTSFDNNSYMEYGVGFALDREEMLYYADQYLSSNRQALDPNVSPLLEQDFGDYSPVTVITAGLDILRDEGTAFANKLSENGVFTRLINYENMVHSFLRFAEYDMNAKRIIDEIVEIIGSSWK